MYNYLSYIWFYDAFNPIFFYISTYSYLNKQTVVQREYVGYISREWNLKAYARTFISRLFYLHVIPHGVRSKCKRTSREYLFDGHYVKMWKWAVLSSQGRYF